MENAFECDSRSPCHIGQVSHVITMMKRDEGAIGLMWTSDGQPRVVFDFTITDGKIVAIDMLADPERLNELDLTVLKE